VWQGYGGTVEDENSGTRVKCQRGIRSGTRWKSTVYPEKRERKDFLAVSLVFLFYYVRKKKWKCCCLVESCWWHDGMETLLLCFCWTSLCHVSCCFMSCCCCFELIFCCGSWSILSPLRLFWKTVAIGNFKPLWFGFV
jgi:hypothetical protein